MELLDLDESPSSGSSSSGDEADYDASEPLIWTAYPVSVPSNPPGTILPPNLVYKPSLQAQYDLSDLQRKRLSRIEEATYGGGGSSANEGGDSDSDEVVAFDLPHPEQSSDERQSDSGVVIIPKYTYQSFSPAFPESTVANEEQGISGSTSQLPGQNIWASTQTTSLVGNSREPIREQTQQNAQTESANHIRGDHGDRNLDLGGQIGLDQCLPAVYFVLVSCQIFAFDRTALDHVRVL
ncbi:unnamed protein product [Echinostoma caproni]|uniref:Uncharacterized protein n=1 Tax=Echinostoma caproni TaxID=27848 RepID=A0A183AB09_9TREM|nr:unnamed protein product [Echinostoma caproni]